MTLLDMPSEDRAGLGSLVGRVSVGMPQSILGPLNDQVVIKNFIAAPSLVDADSSQRQHHLVETVATIHPGSEALSPAVLAGKRLFYHAGSADDFRMSSEGYISCASCHVDGSHDGQTWDFTHRGEGLRNTIDLRGRSGTAHGNLHWTANFDEIHDFENDIRLHFSGTGLMDDDDFAASHNTLGPPKTGLSVALDALAAYVASLDETTLPRSPYRDRDSGTTVEALAGQVIFQQQNRMSRFNRRPTM